MHLVDITMFYAAEGGGVSTYLNAKARWLAQRGRVRHTILSPNVATGGASPALLHLPGIAIPGLHGYRLPLTVGGPARLLRSINPDLIEAGDAGHSALAALRAKHSLHIPAVAFYHSDLPRLVQARFGTTAAKATRGALRRLYRQFDLVLAPSRFMAQQLSAMGVHGALHQPLGIDTTTFSPTRRIETLRRHLRLPPEARLLVYAGRFTADKKLEVLIDAVRRLGRPYHLVLIGGGATLPCYPQTTYIAFKRDQRVLARLLASCDVLVHPGDSETFGLIVLEAMACGLPVVATGGGALAELVDEHTGILVRPNCVNSLSAGIEAIYGCDLAALSQAAVRKAREQHDWDRIMPQLMHRYAGLLAAGQRAALGTEPSCVAE